MWLTNEQHENHYDLRDAHQLYIPFARTDHVKRMPYFSSVKFFLQFDAISPVMIARLVHRGRVRRTRNFGVKGSRNEGHESRRSAIRVGRFELEPDTT